MRNDLRTYFNNILSTFRKKEAKDKSVHILLEFLIVNSLYLILCLILENLWYLSPAIKTTMWLGLTLNVFYLYRGIEILLGILLSHDKSEDEELLLSIGQQHPEINDRLLNHFQLLDTQNKIADYAVQDFIETYPAEYFSNSYHKKPIRRKRTYALICLFLLSLLSLANIPALKRFIHPKTQYEPDTEFTIEITPSELSIYTYDSLSFTIKKQSPENFPVELYCVTDGDKKLVHRTRDSLINYSRGRMTSSATYLARLRRPNIFYPRKFISTDTLNVKLMQRPRIRSMKITVLSPNYSNIPIAVYQGNIDKISILKGSYIELEISLSEPFGPSCLISNKNTLDLNINGNNAHISWIPENKGSFTLNLVNERGIASESDPSYLIEIEKDMYPQLRILDPKISDELTLNEDMSLPYVAHLQDDFGLSSFTVNYSTFSEYSFYNDTTVKQMELPFAEDSRLQTRIGVWKIKDFISPGSELRYYFELSDNDEISGPKTIRSSLFYAKLPTLADLYESQDEAQEETMVMLEDELISTEEIVEELDEIQKQLLQEGEMNWENKAALEENLQSLETAREELKEMQSALEKQKKFMEENALFSDDVMQSFEQLQELMNELIDDEMFDMLQNMQEKLERNDMSNMEEILEDFNEKAKRFEESLDRMLEVFKRIQQEQRLEELGQKIKESLKEQKELLERSDDRSANDLAEQQKKIAAETEKWESLSKESSELFEDESKELFDEYLDKMNDMQISEFMEQAGSEYQKGNKQDGQEQSALSEEKLSDLERSFSQMSSQMMKKQKNEIVEAFQRAFLLSLYLSGRQETRLEEGKELTNASPLIHRYTSGMNDNLQIALEINDGLMELSKKTFLVDKSIGMALGQVIGNLRSGIVNVEEAKLLQGKKNFDLAYEGMNQLARILLERTNMVMDEQKGNASGMEFYMQQLQEMAGQQQQLNSGMPQPGMNGSPGQSMMDQLAKMASRQQALRKRLKQIQQSMSEAEGGNKKTGSLDKIAKDMEDVINQMRRNQVDRQTIMRQEKIVQRLLDASRSATSRDYKKERESTTGKELLRDNPLSLPGDLGDHESLINIIRRELSNSDLTPKEKRDMEKYLESLLGKEFGMEK